MIADRELLIYGLDNNKITTLCIILAGIIAQVLNVNPALGQESDNPVENKAYFDDYSELLALRIYTNTKYNTLDIIKDNQKFTLAPNSPTSLGAGFNYRDYGLAIAFGLPKSKTSKKKYGSTNRLDVQANAYGRKWGFDGFGQIYKGYYLTNPNDFMDWNEDEFPKLPDMRILSVGINTFYIFNNKKFSYKAAYVRNQVQRKSAGSLTLGIFGHLDLANTDGGFKPVELPDSVAYSMDLKGFNTLAVGITIGYFYTWVIFEKFFINLGINPGFGNQRIELETTNEEKSVKNAPAAQLSARGSLGYESKSFFIGITANTTWRNFSYKGYDLDLATEQLKVFIGKRFSIHRNKN